MSNNKKDPETQKIIAKEKTKKFGSDEYAISPFALCIKLIKEQVFKSQLIGKLNIRKEAKQLLKVNFI